MIPPSIMKSFATVPAELIDLCRPHTWDDLTRAPQEGMRSIRDVLVHTMGTEHNWIRHVANGEPRQRLDPVAFGDLDSILSMWTPQRRATLEFVRKLTPEQRASRRPFPWNQHETASVEEIVWHVVTHEQYHRGQIFTRLALLGRRDLPDNDLLR
jgi:uncharacterized damage-inducible protein DinB